MNVIIGAGISGLTLAYELEKQGKPYLLIESTSKVGGSIDSQSIGPYLLELGPNSILVNAELESFFQELDLMNDFVEASSANKNRYIYKNNKIKKAPSGPLQLFFGNFLSFNSKNAILKDLFQKKSFTLTNESVNHFVSSHFTNEVADYLAAPFIAGIYAGDSKDIVMESVFPSLYHTYQNNGSVIKSAIKSGTGRKKTGSFKGGLTTLTKRLHSKLKNIKQGTVKSLQKVNNEWNVELSNNEIITAQTVTICTPTFAASDILRSSYPNISESLDQVKYAGVIGMYYSFKKKDIQLNTDGFGVLFPPIEKQWISGTIWNSCIFKDRAPSEEFICTSFISDIIQKDLWNMKEEEIFERTLKQLQRDLQTNQNPVFSFLKKWKKGIPQYTIELKQAVEKVKSLEKDQIYFCANWVNGIALPTCIENARQLSTIL
ncbi:MAG: protoporphyrinogen oxidase [Cytophagaceae bacterium]